MELHCFARQRDQQGAGIPFQAHGSVGLKLGAAAVSAAIRFNVSRAASALAPLGFPANT
jgi:hypothetical protein